MVSSVKSVCLAVCLFAVLQVAYSDTQVPSLEQLYKQTQEYIQGVGKQIKDSGLVPQEVESSKVVTEVRAVFQKAGDSLLETVKKVEKDGKQYGAEVQKSIEASNKIVNDLVKQLKEGDLKSADKIYDAFAVQAKKLSDQAIELGKATPIKDVIPEKAQSAAKEILEDLSKVSQKVKTKVSEIIAEESKKRP